MKVLFLADFFKEQLLGGGESNDANLIEHLSSRGVTVVKRNCKDVLSAEIEKFEKIIVGNFISLSPENRQILQARGNYIIYEHDHKYVSTRDPSKFLNFNIPSDNIVNKEFYENAQAVVVLSDICKEVLVSAIPAATVHSIGCSLWSSKTLDYISLINSEEKRHEYCILKSANPTKNYPKTREYCLLKGITPIEIQSAEYYEFLKMMGECKNFVFLPTVLETFSRVCVEAQMLNVEVRTMRNLIGFYSESFSHLQGDTLIEKVREKNNKAYQYFYDTITR